SRLAWSQVDDEVAVERVGDAQQCVDPRRPAAALEPGDRGLRRADDLRQLALGQAFRLPALCDLVRDRRKEPTAIGGPGPLPQPLERGLRRARPTMNAIRPF